MNRIFTLAFAIGVACTTTVSANSFVERGAPAPTREWYGPDYERAVRAFTVPDLRLPTRDGGDGEAVFSRLVSVDNLSLARNRTLPIDQRIGDTLRMQQSANQILKLYIGAANSGADVHSEIAEQMAFSLRLLVALLDLVDEFLPTVKKDEKYEVRMDGLRKLKMGTEIAFSGVEESLGEIHFYSADDLSLLVTAMAESLPHLNRAFGDDFRIELRGRLERRASEFKKDDSRDAILAMIKELAQPGATDNPDGARRLREDH